ncbi:MAG: urate hydroxylase PuuD, partial [Vicinamibacteria bacterium]
MDSARRRRPAVLVFRASARTVNCLRKEESLVDTLNALFRWLHILAGIIWIGMLFFFNWVNGPFAATMDGDTKKKVVPELMP